MELVRKMIINKNGGCRKSINRVGNYQNKNIMKKVLIAAFIMLSGFGTYAQFCQDGGWKIEPYADPDGCCVIFTMIESSDDFPWDYWFVVANGETIHFDDAEVVDNVFSVCYDAAGSYNVVVTYVDVDNITICENNWTVTAKLDCACKFNFCWSVNGDGASMQAIEELIGVKVVDKDGVETEYPLFDPALDITSNYATILAAFIEVFVNEEKLDEDAVGEGGTNCFKGDYPQPGFSVFGQYASVSFYGIDDDGNPIEVFFENSCDPERKSNGNGTDNGSNFSNNSAMSSGQITATTVPNPADEMVTITVLDPTNSSAATQLELVIFDINGREVYNGNTIIGSQKMIDVSRFESGLYIYEVRDGETVLLKEKLLIK
ncbi:MAG: hypothetical protein ACI8ZM_001969 [Crocinitomix sp.]|jgi:hypothetical protein